MMIFNFLFSRKKHGRFKLSADDRVELMKALIPEQTEFSNADLNSAMGMAKWAMEGVNVPDLFNRGHIFSRYLAHSDNQEEAISALRYFVDEVRGWEHMPWFLRRDIAWCAFSQFIKPDIYDLIDDLANDYGASEELCNQLEEYDGLSDEGRQVMRAVFDADILAKIDSFYRRIQFYNDHEEYLKMMHDLYDELVLGESSASAG